MFGLLVLRRPRLTWSPIWTILYLLGLPDLRDLRGLCQTRSLARLKLRIFLKRHPAKKIFKKKSSQKPDLRDLRGLCQTRSLARLKLRIFLKRNPAKKIFKKKSSQKIQKNYF